MLCATHNLQNFYLYYPEILFLFCNVFFRWCIFFPLIFHFYILKCSFMKSRWHYNQKPCYLFVMNWTVALYNTKTFKILYVNREVHIQNFPQNTNLQLLVFHVVQYMCMLLSCSVWALEVSFPVFYSSLPLVYMCFGVLTFSMLNFTVAVMVGDNFFSQYHVYHMCFGP